VNRPLGYLSLLLAALLYVVSTAVNPSLLGGEVGGVSVALLVSRLLLSLAVLLVAYGLYTLTLLALERSRADKRRQHDVRNVLRLVFVLGTAVGLLGVVTEQWVGLLFSLGVVGFGITFALQQPLFSLIGWVYIMTKRPYQVGDRVEIEESKGDVVDVDFLVTTLWEIDGDLVTANQPSGRTITLPNSVVLSSHVANFTREEFPFVWNELLVQVAYESDIEYAIETMKREADEYLGDDMARRVEQYRHRLEETPVELDVDERPSVNIRQGESWVDLRLRYLVDPKRAQRTRNELFQRILPALNEEPERVKFPVGRSR
jgi:small-conductance mechanosensitive channel